MKDKFDVLKLENQICFPIYACSKEIIKKYRPLLRELDLTYTQYLVMLIMWEYKSMKIKELGEKLLLDSGTITPVVKSLEKKGFVEKRRSDEDERIVEVSVTELGWSTREKAVEIPSKLIECIGLDEKEGIQLYSLIRKLLLKLQEK
ncbi:MarR family transcriptional regulator [Peptostreptococcus porci]|uniref:MarR family winged helix-turn-helix transcriptional regulator n=1 Tax=Peptostreptococcus porci TaxID=2652282 RepID=UPI002A75443D|nr:MarR family transcriptional regulator [Peptostreptococcus porci]MDY2795063.1 MarR family transcriptional regulator [Peptostreptococcus porci]MDY5436756.1 MarR family transcriptional regulator [Peptostreptococcus porci]MDY5479314.1 MarR family transcriptional regulator [Peptostreptococcus porci]MDY6232695.1 MarR family transcriptional regulator [Peptostreptococcus porci]